MIEVIDSDCGCSACFDKRIQGGARPAYRICCDNGGGGIAIHLCQKCLDELFKKTRKNKICKCKEVIKSGIEALREIGDQCMTVDMDCLESRKSSYMKDYMKDYVKMRAKQIDAEKHYLNDLLEQIKEAEKD